MEILKSWTIFIIAGVCEIGGGWLVWQYVREEKSVWYGIIGGAVLVGYGFVATLQTANFARVYATYGGFFIAMSLLWAYRFDNYSPDRYDVIGALVALLGVCIIYYAPRG
ncbi:YnfA family protein [Dawidia soli]|uniref:YnfA family protein n=1 Tax=Dawidia soli TaxID=2782352 RepID=A0AAP2GH91_9BACT|nr:YnfA family protein [Dawidia soli]MBT1686165.1 YnfA family protein [Dawidia soli]